MSQVKQLSCGVFLEFSLLPFVQLLITNSGIGRGEAGGGDKKSNCLSQAQLKSNPSSPCLCILSFPCFHQELYSVPAISFSKVAGHRGGWGHMHTSLSDVLHFLVGVPLVLWPGQSHYAW